MNKRVAWLLLFTYVVLLNVVFAGFVRDVDDMRDGLVLGCVGIILAAFDIFSWPSSQPYPSSRSHDDYEDYGIATYTHDQRLYLVVPSSLSLMIAGVFIMAGICSRKIFTTTVALYSSLGLWILNLVIAILYQNVPVWNRNSYNTSTFLGVIGVQIGILILLAIQVILAMWELRRQKADWPVFNFSNIFTLCTVLVVTKMTLAVYTAVHFYYSQMIWGFMKIYPEYQHSNLEEQPTLFFPEAHFVFPCAVACAYGLIVSFEGVASHFFGQMHNRLVACTTLISAICYGGLGVVTSPAFVNAVIGNYRVGTDVLIFASLMSTLNFIHAFTCLIFPSALTTTPKFLRVVFDHLLSINSSSQDSGMNQMPRETILSSYNAISNAAVALRKKFSGSDALIVNIISTVVSLLAVILTSISFNGPWRGTWGAFMMLAGDTAVFSRTMPLAVTEVVNRTTVTVPVLQQTISYILENSFLFAGAIRAICMGYPGTLVAAGVFNLMFVLFQNVLLMRNCGLLCKIISSESKVTQGSEERQPFAAEGPEDAQVLKDEIQDGGSQCLA